MPPIRRTRRLGSARRALQFADDAAEHSSPSESETVSSVANAEDNDFLDDTPVSPEIRFV